MANNTIKYEYKLWQRIKALCYRKTYDEYEKFGGKGITVCDEWVDDFKAFETWLLQQSNGKRCYIKLKENAKEFSAKNCIVITVDDILSPNVNTLPGKKFGKLSVRKYDGSRYLFGKNIHYWICDCSCGGTIRTTEQDLLMNRTTSCGCNFAEVKNDPEFKVKCVKLHLNMVRMKTRCYDPSCDHYKYYGAKGIGICDEWRYDDEAFIVWSIKNGFEPRLTIERKNINKGYSPDNCLWIPPVAQAINKSNNVFYELNEKTHHLSEWGRLLGFLKSTYTKNPKAIRNKLEKLGGKEVPNPNLS